MLSQTGWAPSWLRWLVTPAVRGLLLLLALLVVYTVYHRVLWSPMLAPPGSDGGNWLALGRELFGESVKAAPVVYPPLLPALLGLVKLVLPPLAALKLVAWFAAASVSIPVYFLLRGTLRPWLAASLAFTVCTIGYANETLAWGGYPQLLGASLLLFGVYFGRRGLISGQRRYLVISAVITALMAATHTLAVLECAFLYVVLALVYYYAWRGGRLPPVARGGWRLIMVWAAATVLLALLRLPLYLTSWELFAGNALNLWQRAPLAALGGAGGWPAEFYIWTVLGVIGGLSCGWLVLRRRDFVLGGAAFSVLAAASFAFVVTGELRTFHLLQIGILLALGMSLTWALRRLSFFRAALPRAVLLGAVVVVLASLGYFGEMRAVRAFNWYRVVDAPLLQALDWLRDHGQPRELVVAGEAPRGQIPGWWVEGYAGLPAYLAVDTQWLFFDAEKQQAVAAHAMLTAPATVAELKALTAEHGVRHVLLHKEVIGAVDPRPALIEAGFRTSLENDSVVILSYRGPE